MLLVSQGLGPALSPSDGAGDRESARCLLGVFRLAGPQSPCAAGLDAGRAGGVYGTSGGRVRNPGAGGDSLPRKNRGLGRWKAGTADCAIAGDSRLPSAALRAALAKTADRGRSRSNDGTD